MSYGAAGAGAAAAQQAALAQATRAMGPIVELEANDWLDLVRSMASPVVVHGIHEPFKIGSWRLARQAHRYLVPFYGLFLYTQVHDPLTLPDGITLIEAKRLWVPAQ